MAAGAMAACVGAILALFLELLIFPREIHDRLSWYFDFERTSETSPYEPLIDDDKKQHDLYYLQLNIQHYCEIIFTDFVFLSERITTEQQLVGFHGDYYIQWTYQSQNFIFHGETSAMASGEDAAKRNSLSKIPKLLASEGLINENCI